MNLSSTRGRKLALRAFDVARLRELVDLAKVDVADRRSRDGLIQALADGRRVDFWTLLQRMTRDDLKAMCRAVGLPDDGREKAPIIERLMGPSGAPVSDDAVDAPVVRPWRLEIIELLKRDELVEICEKFEIPVQDRRVVQNLRVAVDLADVSLNALLEGLPRTRLKEICRVQGLDEGGREKAVLIHRIAERALSPDIGEEGDGPDEPEGAHAYGPEVLAHVLGRLITIEEEGRYWPAHATTPLRPEGVLDLHVRVIGATGRNPLERRFQNPVGGAAITPVDGRPCLLLGVWIEQGLERTVIVGFDAYRRRDKLTRFSLFVPLSVLESAADVGFVMHERTNGERIYAFRPEAFNRYLEAFVEDGNWGDSNAGWASVVHEPEPRVEAPKPEVTSSVSFSPSPAAPKESVEIRPKSGMYAAFARLNYKPWYALAELVDNAVQSFFTHRERLIKAGSSGPLIVDIDLEDDELTVTDRAAGIALKDFPRAFSPATPPDDTSGLSEFGLGMKAAACWFADQWSVRTSALDESVERTIAFDVPKIAAEGLEELPIKIRESRPSDHFTIISMRKLRVRPRGSTLAKIKEHLASIYRLLIADGSLQIRFTSAGKTEFLSYEQPKLLVAPFFAKPNDPPLLWRQELRVEIGERLVTGWAGLLASGKYARAGFSVFRRNRLIEGSVGEAYRPRSIFKAPNTFISQRLVGELHVEGFDVSHTKDGIQWGEDEQDIAYEIRMQLDTDAMPMLDQAEGYRARRTAASLPDTFGSDAIAETIAAVSDLRLERDTPAEREKILRDEPPATDVKVGDILQERSIDIRVEDEESWTVRVELVRDKAEPWLVSHLVDTKEGPSTLQIRINLDHPFSEKHLNDNEKALSPVVRLAVAFALGEQKSRMQGVKSCGSVRKNANVFLEQALSNVVLNSGKGEV